MPDGCSILAPTDKTFNVIEEDEMKQDQEPGNWGETKNLMTFSPHRQQNTVA